MKNTIIGVIIGVIITALIWLIVPSGSQVEEDVDVSSLGTINLKVANFFPPPTFQSRVLEEFCKELESRTKGVVKVDYYTGSSLLNATAMYEGVINGIADLGYSHVYYTAGRMPAIEACGLPLGFPTGWVASQVMNDFYDKFKPKDFDEVRVLWLNSSPSSAIATSKRPVRKLEDLKGLTIRAPGMAGEVIKALGGNPAPTKMNEVYDAISKGVIDGETSNFETLLAFKFAEVVKYSTSVWQINNVYPFYLVMNKNSYNKLPASIKTIFNKLIGEYKERYITMWNAIDFIGKGFGLKKGVKFIELPPSELSRWQNAVKPVIDGYVKRMAEKGYTEQEIRDWLKYMKERSDYWYKKQIDLRIPSAAGPSDVRPTAYSLD